MNDNEKTITLADGKIELTVIKFETMRGFEMLGKMEASGAQKDPAFLRAMLSGSLVIRHDDKGNKESISLGAGDSAINKAFRGCSLAVLIEAQNFAMEVNFADFFADAERKMAAKRAAEEAKVTASA